MKLNSEAAQAAWADYKGFMLGMGVNLENARGIEQAFKYAFAAGQAHKEEVEAAPAVSIDTKPIAKFNAGAVVAEAIETLKTKPVITIDNKPYAEFKKGANVADLDPEVAEKLQRKTGIKRPKSGPVVRRSERTRRIHARLVEGILQTAGKAMQLQDIIKQVNAAGADWNPKSASGHMLDAMEFQPCIKKVGFGLYEYQQ